MIENKFLIASFIFLFFFLFFYCLFLYSFTRSMPFANQKTFGNVYIKYRNGICILIRIDNTNERKIKFWLFISRSASHCSHNHSDICFSFLFLVQINFNCIDLNKKLIKNKSESDCDYFFLPIDVFLRVKIFFLEIYK